MLASMFALRTCRRVRACQSATTFQNSAFRNFRVCHVNLLHCYQRPTRCYKKDIHAGKDDDFIPKRLPLHITWDIVCMDIFIKILSESHKRRENDLVHGSSKKNHWRERTSWREIEIRTTMIIDSEIQPGKEKLRTKHKYALRVPVTIIDAPLLYLHLVRVLKKLFKIEWRVNLPYWFRDVDFLWRISYIQILRNLQY